ncbi:ADK2 [Symbiodinium pilosum]|uniref:Adenosine kinase n=1 Tax=Symbiodinium pilosum TaxID=2952 RepID=A0A812Y322_SYMPI|nr:ADK2 [Symbiodinium pilosum]
MQAVRSRRTCRAFQRRPVTQETVEELLSLASRAPSGGNTQPWHVYVVAGMQLEALTDAAFVHLRGMGKQNSIELEYNVYPRKADMPPDLHKVYMSRRIQLAESMWRLRGITREDAAGRYRMLLDNYRFWGAPVGMIITVDRCCDRNAWGHAGLLLQSIALLAVERGLATAMLEAWGNLGSCVYDALNISMDREVVWCGVALGYPDHSGDLSGIPTDRLDVHDFCRFQGFVSRQNFKVVIMQKKKGRHAAHFGVRVVDFVLDARYGEEEAVQDAIAAGVQVNARSHGGSTALFMASANGNVGIVRKLLDARASTDLANDAGNCPLHWASLNGHVEVVKMLIAARANANLKNDFQKRPFDEALSRSHSEICETLAAVTSFEDDIPADAEAAEAMDLIDSAAMHAVVPAKATAQPCCSTAKHAADVQEGSQEVTSEKGSMAQSQAVAACQHEPGATGYMGCVGADGFGERLARECEAAGVTTRLLVDREAATGTCAVTILDGERSLTTRLGAANMYKLDHAKQPENFTLLRSAKIIYSAGFFITVSPESIDLASRVAEMSGAIYCLNLSATFVVQVPAYRAMLEKTLPYCDFLFGNETEARAYAEAAGWDSSDIGFIATRLSLVPMAGKKPHRKIVITQGAEPIVVAERGHVTLYPVPQLPSERIVDTNGAGDAFVGGFLAALLRGRKLADCCQAGSCAAVTVIQHSGCTFPREPSCTP